MLLEILKKNQKELWDFTKKKLKGLGYRNIVATQDYVFAMGNIPVMMVAHLDTVHAMQPKNIFFDKKQKVLWSPERNWWR